MPGIINNIEKALPIAWSNLLIFWMTRMRLRGVSESAAGLLSTTLVCLLHCEAPSEAKEGQEKRVALGTALRGLRE